MNKFLSKSVIVPFDFSEMSFTAIKETLDMVEQDRIIVVHVTPYPAGNDPAILWGNYTEDTIASNLHKTFAEQCEEKKLPVDLKFITVFGDPGSNIAQIASEHSASLIVISSHGRTGLSRMLLGSVAERVIRLAPCPVLVLRNQESTA